MGKSSRSNRRSGPAHARRGLQDTLVLLWQKLVSTRQPPAIDRFLARELGRLDGFPRRERLWLGDILTDGLRFGALAVFAESWRRDGWQPGTPVEERLRNHPGPCGDELWRRLARLPVPVLFFWIFMRKRLTGAELPTIAAPGPDALEVWRTMKQQAPQHPSPDVRALWAGLPPALLPQLRERAASSGWTAGRFTTFLDNHATRPPVWLRLLDAQALPKLRAELTAAGFSSDVDELAIRVQGERGVYELPGYRSGTFDIQDRASQGIGDAVSARPGELIWDCCAGAGGKSLQLAAAMNGKGLVFATDIHEHKLKDLRRRASRTGFTIIRDELWDGRTLPRFDPIVRNNGGFDRVLIDAPCSGSGTWRRNVDGRLRFVPKEPNPWTPLQSGLLELTSAAVKPGGYLIYATCSWLTEENEDVCRGFAESHPQWRLVAKNLMGNPDLDSDTTFCAVFENVVGR